MFTPHMYDFINRTLFSKHLKIVVVAIIIVLTSTLLLGSRHISGFNRYVLDDQLSYTTDTGIVFGSGITKDGRPYDELKARLDTAAHALENGVVNQLILSGDNRFDHYDEPQAMIDYLTQVHGVDEAVLQPDFAGRSTYETCERAKSIFSVDTAILFSARSHLPRAIFTCRSFGIEAFGIGNDVEANNATRRELLARAKALFNVYIKGENTIGGEKISLTEK